MVAPARTDTHARAANAHARTDAARRMNRMMIILHIAAVRLADLLLMGRRWVVDGWWGARRRHRR